MGSETTWILSDGRAGHLNQCLGLAEALGCVARTIAVGPSWPWSALPPSLVPRPLVTGIAEPGGLHPPWPDLLIAAGRRTVAPAAALKRAAGRATFAVMLQDPGAFRGVFDAIVAPHHDGLAGANVIATDGALNRVTPDGLAAAAGAFGPALAGLPRPLVAVLIGGASRTHRMDAAAARRMAADLSRLRADHGAGLAVTVSGRTGEENAAILRAALQGDDVRFWDGTGDNPYFGFLALADFVVVTGDSVSMVSEACTAGKPVYVLPMAGGSAKFERFHGHLRARGLTRPFDGTLEAWSVPPLADAGAAAAEIRRRIATRASPS